ncbi:MAG TPA: hypothetical protein VMG12_45690 [Polyangiaceae bacterium]|nr:hypothetical protein [Polyangiaceae bacterium]
MQVWSKAARISNAHGAEPRRVTRVATALALLALACGDSDSPTALGGAGEVAQDGPLYALGVRVRNADSTTGYILTVPSIDAGTTWSLDRAIEVGRDAWLSGTDGSPEVRVASSQEPTITRWQAQADGSLVQDATLTFQNLGLARSREARGNTSLYLRDKAYFLSSDGQIVVWNPNDMTILGTIPYAGVAGFTPEGLFTGDEEHVLVSLTFSEDNPVDSTIYRQDVRLIEIDPRTDQIVSETEDPRCNRLYSMSRAPNGSTYYSAPATDTPLRVMLGEGHGPKDCSLRIQPPQTGFDASFNVDLTQLVDGRPAGGLVMVTDDVAFLRVWHEELAPPLAADKSNYQELVFASAYQWWRWPLGSDRAELAPDQMPTTGQWDPFAVDGRALLPVIASDFGSTELVELLPEGGMRPLISGPGTLLGIVRVR